MSDFYKNMMDEAFKEYYERFLALNATSKENAVTLYELFPDKRPFLYRDRMHKMLSCGIVKRVGFNRYWLDESRASDSKAVLFNRLLVVLLGIAFAIVLLLADKFGIISL
ncbi:MAG: hypothetical protein E7539_05130 [Ruminococcaceae bacterium]|nr:hypothetical protein [Oscillospiraceae bacterium]